MRSHRSSVNDLPDRRAVRCRRCNGSVLFDRLDEEWRCLQCGRVQPRETEVLRFPEQPQAA